VISTSSISRVVISTGSIGRWGSDLDGLDRPGGGDLDKLDQPGAVISKGLIGRWGSDLDGLDQRLAVLGTREGPPPCGDGPSSDWK